MDAGKRAASKTTHETACDEPTDTTVWPAAGPLRGVRRMLAILFIVAYLGTTLWFHFRHVLGDSNPRPVAYFWVWDMFPSIRQVSQRRVVVGETRSGKYVRVLPGPNERYRWGVADDLPRFDILSTVETPPYNQWLLSAIDADLQRTKELQAHDPIVAVRMFEQYWPAHFNLPPDLYREAYGIKRPERRYWRFLGDADVDPATARMILPNGESAVPEPAVTEPLDADPLNADEDGFDS